ncbi:threonine/homoserine/homoserine lactone efflux protein [Amycolatopsis bartoniae]|uniref:Lysine transporter LysE n=1 Tax=Amycolatopsis bartoniae TaxID=941986 RepID=A0A8H9IU12_9PSEU|nr:LysE family translocator [Amycolatopsis bartoniae]MBB2939201.1 threonine/homoserine/homoserine lactone efflux protein [Amycolatopsis bartoniae]TVT09600.1 LysE family translocator [Amycolatopsis bartoniae]GHF38248.1 lysine transporter LysE [Amycolatopsis bartoniae]
MVSPGAFAAFAALVFVMIVVPGPSVLFTISRALTVGRRDALLTVAGNAAGVYTQVVAVAFGLGVLVRTSAAVFTVIKLAGAGYLVYLGVQAIRHRRGLADALSAAVPTTPGRTLRVLRDGFVVGLANPKSIVFLAAVLPQFVTPSAGRVPLQVLLLGVCLPAIAVLSDSAWALVAGAARSWFARSPRRLALIGGTGGAVMIGLGVGIALTGRRD